MARKIDNDDEAPLLKPSLIPEIRLDRYFDRLPKINEVPLTLRGRVRRVSGLIITARLPNARLGDICLIEPPGRTPVRAQVVGFDDDDVFLTSFDPLYEIGPKTQVVNLGRSLRVPVGSALLGRVVDSLGTPIDGLGPIRASDEYSVRNAAPSAMSRRRISKILPVGVRAIDTLLTVGEGQRLGLFSSAGVGKSSLLGMIARNSTADVNVVALVGERGREVQDFLQENLGKEGLSRSVVVISTSDEPALRRITAAYTATAIAEYFRDCGKRVMLLMDSVTRFARSLREIALSIGEPPARQGYPPSVFATLPELFERAGNSEHGSITAFYTVLLSSEQLEDPLGEEIRAILDGHFYLSSRLSHLQHFPAIDLLTSSSRVMQQIVREDHRALAERMKRVWAIYEENRDLINIGAYKRGSDPEVDEAISLRDKLVNFLIQRPDERESLEKTIERAKQNF